MPVPPRGDPRRPLHLAVSSCRLLGVLGLLAGTCSVAPMFLARLGGPALATTVLSTAILCGGGAGLLILAHHITRRRFWAVVTALVLASAGTLALTAMTLGTAYVMLSIQTGLQREPIFWVVLGCYGLIALALAQLVYHLARSFPALKIGPPDEARGFDVLPVAVLPSEPTAPKSEDGNGAAQTG